MAKEDYIGAILLLCLTTSFYCKADENENREPVTDDFKDRALTVTAEKLLPQIRTNSSEQDFDQNNSKTSAKNLNSSKILNFIKYLQLHNESLAKNGKNIFNITSKESLKDLVYNENVTKSNRNVLIELSDNSTTVNSKNSEYEVIYETDNNTSLEDEKSPQNHFYSVETENSETTEALLSQEVVSDLQGNTGNEHPCSRECKKGEEPMTCYYKFDVEWYYTMSKACYNCTVNKSDCFRQDCIAANGIKRSIIVVNRTLPGPSIEVCFGDEIIVDVHNHLIEETTTIHWHGHHQRGSPYMDGVPFITQCPITPHSTFRYNYLAVSPGTHFWHSHTGCQRTDGLVGNMIIRSPRSEDPHSHLYDEDLNEHVINIMDWAHELGVTMFLAHYHSDGDNKPESIIVNGKGRYFKDSENVTSTPLAIFNVKQGMRYRFRLINAGNQNCPIELSIDNHTIIAINSDGGDFQPVEGAALVSYAGERWDFILNANRPVKNYWIRFKGLMDCDERFTKAHQVSILHYEGASDDEPKEPVSYFGPEKFGLTINAMNVRMDDPHSISVPALVGIDALVANDPSLHRSPDHQFYIGYDFYPVDAHKYHKPTLYGFKDVKNLKERVYTPQFNHISMKMPSIPLLSQRNSVSRDMFCDHKSLKNCTDNPQCECTNVIEIPLGDVVELVLIDEGHTYNANHPFHLHGHTFRVIGMDRLGESTTVETVKNLDKSGLLRRNLISAPLKDSVTVPDGGYTIIRFHATNPGYWLFHCHLEFHVEVGMALIFKVGEHFQFPPVPEKFPTCGDYLNPKLPIDKLKNWNSRENEVNFGDDYSITYNVTHGNKKDEDDRNKSIFKLSQLWPLKSSSNSAININISDYKHFILISVSLTLISNTINL